MVELIVFIGVPIYVLYAYIGYRYVKRTNMKLIVSAYLIVIIFLPTWDVILGTSIHTIFNSLVSELKIYKTVKSSSILYDGLFDGADEENGKLYLLRPREIDRGYKYMEFKIYNLYKKGKRIYNVNPFFFEL